MNDKDLDEIKQQLADIQYKLSVLHDMFAPLLVEAAFVTRAKGLNKSTIS